MAPPAAAEPHAGGFAGRLTAKVGPLPVWAWAALILGAVLLYMKLQPAAASTPEPAPAPPAPTGETDAGAVFASGGGGGELGGASGDALAQIYGTNAGTIDNLTNALLTQRSLVEQLPAGIAPGSVAQGGPSSSSTPAATAAAGAAATKTPPKPAQLLWDGKIFTTQAGFQAWAKAHGTSVAKIFSTHPAAKAIYSTLK